MLRRIDEVPWWSRRPRARAVPARARGRLRVAGKLGIAPPLLFAGRRVLVRGWIDGVPLHIAKPHGDAAYFRSAKAALAQRCIAPASDAQRSRQGAELARTPTAAPMSPISSSRRAFRRRSALFRLARYEDLRHLLKHKRRYAPEALTAAERRVLARKSWITRRLDGDRQEGLLRRSRAACNYHRPRRRRPAPRLRGAGHRRTAARRTRTCATSPSSPFPTAAPAPGSMLSSRGERERPRAARIPRRPHGARASAGRRRPATRRAKARCAAKFCSSSP